MQRHAVRPTTNRLESLSSAATAYKAGELGFEPSSPCTGDSVVTLDWPPGPLREEVVVTGGGVVLGDDGGHIEGERPQIEDAAAHSGAVAAAHTHGAAVGLVEQDLAVDEREVRRAEGRGAAVEDAPALAVAAVAARRAVPPVAWFSSSVVSERTAVTPKAVRKPPP